MGQVCIPLIGVVVVVLKEKFTLELMVLYMVSASVASTVMFRVRVSVT